MPAPPLIEVDLSDLQGRTFDSNETGTRITFGRHVKRFILLMPVAASNVYFTIGKAGLLEDEDNSAAHLDETYPVLEAGESYKFDLPNVQARTLELRCASGGTVTRARIVLI